MDPAISSLLTLQEYDIKRVHAEEQIEHIPLEIKSLEAKIKLIQDGASAARDHLKSLEVQRSASDKDLKDAENKIVQLKTKQLEVKKNEEYQALITEIEHQEAAVSSFEDKEIELLDLIDTASKELTVKLAESKLRVEGLEGQIRQLNKQKSELDSKVDALKQAVADAEQDVPRPYLSKYAQVRNATKGPYVVKLDGQRCLGCHLKVSNEVQGDVKKGEMPVQCDSCSRILYIES